MKIVAVMGSPHGMKGTTGRLLAPLVDAARAAGATVQTFDLAHLAVLPCRACDCCHLTGRCGQDDDFEAIRAAIEASDGLVLATPNYISSASAQLKALLDRCCGPLHLQAFEGKYGAAVVSSGGPGSAEVEQYLLRFLNTLGLWTVGSVGAEARELADPALAAAPVQAAANLGRRLVDAIKRRETFPSRRPPAAPSSSGCGRWSPCARKSGRSSTSSGNRAAACSGPETHMSSTMEQPLPPEPRRPTTIARIATVVLVLFIGTHVVAYPDGSWPSRRSRSSRSSTGSTSAAACHSDQGADQCLARRLHGLLVPCSPCVVVAGRWPASSGWECEETAWAGWHCWPSGPSWRRCAAWVAGPLTACTSPSSR